MTDRSYSPAGALRRFKCTGGQQLFFLQVLRTALDGSVADQGSFWQLGTTGQKIGPKFGESQKKVGASSASNNSAPLRGGGGALVEE